MYYLLIFHLFIIANICLSQEKPIIVVIPSYNNAKYYKANLDSIIKQKYTDYHIIYMDDCSPDGTGKLVEQYIKSKNLEHKITLIKYMQREHKLKHMYEIIHSLDDWALVVLIDGDDWLAHDQVFSRINEFYNNNDIWFTYGQCIQSCKNGVTFAKPLPECVIMHALFRKHEWVYSHLRTFYAWLFKNIRLADFITDQSPGFMGKFHPCVDDVAFTFPMIEMARKHYKFISEIIYIYNSENPISIGKTARTLPTIGLQELKNKPLYNELTQPIMYEFDEKKAYPVILLFQHDVHKTQHILWQLVNKLKNYGSIIVLQDTYHESSLEQNVVYFKTVDSQNVAKDLYDLLQCYETDYVVFGNDLQKDIPSIDLHETILFLEKTQAYSLQLLINSNDMKNLTVQSVFNMYCWKFSCNSNARNLIHNIQWTLYRKTDVLRALYNKQAKTTLDVENVWQQHLADMDNVGLLKS